MSDLLAFELAIEQSSPGAVMCAYNRINESYGCENAWLLNDVLKSDWGYKGFVMSGPRPAISISKRTRVRLSVDYTVEGAAVGYKWFDRTGATPLFPFGFGLSCGRFGLLRTVHR
jgi:hypothetical protein